MTTRPLTLALAALAAALPCAAQPAPKPERAFISISGGVQAATPKGTDAFAYEVHAETARVNARYPGGTLTLVDATVGVRLFKSAGLAVSVASAGGDAPGHVEASMPHPFFDNRDRAVSGDTSQLSRAQTAIHAQLFVLKAAGRWRLRLLGGATHFRVEQDVITGVHVREEYPFDVAEFASVERQEGSGTGFGFNVGADAAWMLTRGFGFGGLVRYTRGSVELNAGGGRRVSIDAGGVQAGAGIRFVF